MQAYLLQQPGEGEHESEDPAVMRKLDTLVADYPYIYSRTAQDEVSKTSSLLKSCVCYRKPRKLSDEQREQAREMMIKRNREK